VYAAHARALLDGDYIKRIVKYPHVRWSTYPYVGTLPLKVSAPLMSSPLMSSALNSIPRHIIPSLPSTTDINTVVDTVVPVDAMDIESENVPVISSAVDVEDESDGGGLNLVQRIKGGGKKSDGKNDGDDTDSEEEDSEEESSEEEDTADKVSIAIPPTNKRKLTAAMGLRAKTSSQKDTKDENSDKEGSNQKEKLQTSSSKKQKVTQKKNAELKTLSQSAPSSTASSTAPNSAPNSALSKKIVKPSKARAPKRRRCGVCEACSIVVNCNTCKTCLDKPRNGGPGTMKQACIYRKCTQLIRVRDVNPTSEFASSSSSSSSSLQKNSLQNSAQNKLSSNSSTPTSNMVSQLLASVIETGIEKLINFPPQPYFYLFFLPFL
jgi:hypothetical protein